MPTSNGWPRACRADDSGPRRAKLDTKWRTSRPTLAIKETEISVLVGLVARMADRLWKLGNDARRQHYVAKAKARLEVGPMRRSDAATVIAAGGVGD